jgi:hypothetical protein
MSWSKSCRFPLETDATGWNNRWQAAKHYLLQLWLYSRSGKVVSTRLFLQMYSRDKSGFLNTDLWGKLSEMLDYPKPSMTSHELAGAVWLLRTTYWSALIANLVT